MIIILRKSVGEKKTLAQKQKIKPQQQPFAKQWSDGRKLYIHDTESILI